MTGPDDDVPTRVVRFHFEVGMEWLVQADSDEEALEAAQSRYDNGDCDRVVYDHITCREVVPPRL